MNALADALPRMCWAHGCMKVLEGLVDGQQQTPYCAWVQDLEPEGVQRSTQPNFRTFAALGAAMGSILCETALVAILLLLLPNIFAACCATGSL